MDQADKSPQTRFHSRRLLEVVPGKGGRKSSKRDSGSKATPRKDSTTRNSQPYVAPPPSHVVFSASIPGQCEDDQQIHTKQYSSPLVSSMVDTQLRPMTVPVTVNTDRIAELEKLVHDGKVEKKLLKKMMDEKHREKVQVQEQLKLLEAESIEKKELERTLSEVRKKLERSEFNNRAREGQLTELNQLKGFSIQNKRLEDELKTKEYQLNATNVELHQLKQTIDHKDKELEEVRIQSKRKLEEELHRIIETEQRHKIEKPEALKATEVELLKKEIDRLKAEVNLKDQSLEEQREQFEALLYDVREADTIVVENCFEGAGASSLSEEDKKLAQLTEQLIDKEDEVEKLTKQLQVKTSEVASLEDKKVQLEQQLTHTVDYTAALAQKKEYDKELQDIHAERRHYKTLESHNTNLQVEIQQLKQELLSVKVSRQLGEETIADLQQQLKEKDGRIQGLTRASEEKTALVDESYRVLRKSTERFEKTIEQQATKLKVQENQLEENRRTIEASVLAVQKLKQDKESAVMTVRRELEERCAELEQLLTRANEENKKIEREKEELQLHCHEKEQVVQELNQVLLRLRIEFRAAQEQYHDLQGELSSLQEHMTDLRDVSEGKGKRIQQLSDLIDTDEKKLSELEEDLTVAHQQNEIFQEEITRSVKEEKGARQVIAQLQSELDKKKQVLSKSGKKSLDDLMVKMEIERNELKAKVHTCKENEEKLNDMLHGKVMREVELEERLEKMKAGNKVLKQKKDTFEKELEEANKACTLYQTQLATEKANHHEKHAIMIQDMRNANMVLQQKLRQSWDQEKRLQEEIKELQEVLIRAESDSPSWLLDSSEVIVTDENLGTGSYGTVQVALFRGTRVAAKCMHKAILSDYNKELFVKEMNMSASLHHPNIVQFIGALVKDNNSILLYELMETSLYSYMQEAQPLPRPLIISISCDVASALAYLHLHKPHPIIHRDVSSPNVLMESLSRGRWRCKLSDFGSSRLQPNAKTEIPGNPHYSSHEAGDPANHTPAMDVYSFGVLLTEITLRRPPESDTVSRERQAKRIDWVPVPMKDLVLQCLMKDRLKRPKILTVIDCLGGFL